MDRRNFLVTFILWVLSFFFGYKLSHLDFKSNDGLDNEEMGDIGKQVISLRKKTNNWISVEEYKHDSNSWNDAFVQAFSDALSQKKNIVLPNGEVHVSSSITLTRPIKIRGYGDTESNLSFDKNQTVIVYQGKGPFFQIEIPKKHGNWSGFAFTDFRFISQTGKGGFLAVNKGKVMQAPDTGRKNPFGNQSCGHLRRPYFKNLIIQKLYTNAEPVTFDGSIGIEAVAMMNGHFENCKFEGWDLALSLPQSDINYINNCLFVSNAQIASLQFENTYGSQNKFTNCDFQVRRLGVGDLYQFIDHARHTKFDNCYFEIGGAPSETRIKGWFDFNGGSNHQVESARFDDINTARVTSHFAFITRESMLVTFDKCHASVFNDDMDKIAYVEPRDKAKGYARQSNRGVMITGSSPQFLSFFDLTNSSIVYYSAQWGAVEKTREDKNPKRVTFNVHNMIEEEISAYKTVKDTLSTGGHVFQLPSQTAMHENDLSLFLRVNQSIIKTGGMYRITVRARYIVQNQKAKLKITVSRSPDKVTSTATIGRHYEQNGGSDRYFQSELLMKSTGLSTTWQDGEYIWLTISAINESGESDVNGAGVLIDNIEIEEIPDSLYLKGSDGNLYVLTMNTSTSTLTVSKKVTFADMNPEDHY